MFWVMPIIFCYKIGWSFRSSISIKVVFRFSVEFMRDSLLFSVELTRDSLLNFAKVDSVMLLVSWDSESSSVSSSNCSRLLYFFVGFLVELCFSWLLMLLTRFLKAAFKSAFPFSSLDSLLDSPSSPIKLFCICKVNAIDGLLGVVLPLMVWSICAVCRVSLGDDV